MPMIDLGEKINTEFSTVKIYETENDISFVFSGDGGLGIHSLAITVLRKEPAIFAASYLTTEKRECL